MKQLHLHSELLRTRLSFKKKKDGKGKKKKTESAWDFFPLFVCVYGCGFLERLGGYKSGPPA